MVDVFGSDVVPPAEILAAVEPRVRAYAEQRISRGRAETEPLKQELIATIHGLGDFAFVDINIIRYFDPQPHGRAFVTIDLVDARDRAPRMTFLPAPTGPAEDPGGLLAAWNEYEQLALELLSSGELASVPPKCEYWHCIVGFEHPRLAPYRERLAQATQHQKRLYAVLASSRDENQRATAAFVLAHTKDGKRLVNALVARIADPSAAARNNALRVLGYVAKEHPEIDIPLDPILRALEFPTTTDRNKALFILQGLATSRPKLHPTIKARAGKSLVAMLRLEQPNNHDFAWEILKLLRGQDLGERNYDAWDSWLREK